MHPAVLEVITYATSKISNVMYLERNNYAWDFTRRSLIISGREVSLVRQENWEPAVCMESNCAAVITSRQAREHAHNGFMSF